MSVRSRASLFLAFYLVGGLLVIWASFAAGVGVWPPLLWFLIFGVSQFWILRCPYCHASATRIPGVIPCTLRS